MGMIRNLQVKSPILKLLMINECTCLVMHVYLKIANYKWFIAKFQKILINNAIQ